jgi:hypothetical protein
MMSDETICVGLRAQKGGAVIVAVSIAAGEPRLLHSTVLATCADGDRLAFEPYRMAREMAPADAASAVAEGRRSQEAKAAQGLQEIASRLGEPPRVAALLVNRAGWITDLLEYSLAWPEHVPVAELLAVRDALRYAARHCGIGLAELDEKSLPESAAQALGLSAAEIEARLKALGLAAGKPWRKEQKLACLAAWVTAARH